VCAGSPGGPPEHDFGLYPGLARRGAGAGIEWYSPPFETVEENAVVADLEGEVARAFKELSRLVSVLRSFALVRDDAQAVALPERDFDLLCWDVHAAVRLLVGTRLNLAERLRQVHEKQTAPARVGTTT
jgi:hypothetical protein